jgi:hexosaminidase
LFARKREFIPMIRKFGATGVLIEYEETFPFEGELAEARYGYAYTKDDIGLIKRLCKENNLKIIPLVQTYGHLEWLLKIKKFAHLRENAEYPQVITPCLEQTYTVLYGTFYYRLIRRRSDGNFTVTSRE